MINEKNWKRIKAAYEKLQSEKKALQAQIAKLEKAGSINGKISYKYRENKHGVRVAYARLLTTGGGNEYIGLDAERIQRIQASIDRYADCVRLRAELRDVDRFISEMQKDFSYVVESHCWE